MIADADATIARQIQESEGHRLGNLTISGYNSSLGNLTFSEKRDKVDKRGSFVGYRNGLYLNKSLSEKESWSREDIDQRTQAMADDCLALFSL